jgi:predicted DsbA family dithiol-disulfide isomerase
MEGMQAGSPAPVVVEVWADLGCPWCYVGKHRLEEAISRRPDAGRFSVKISSFELNPDAPHEPETIESAFIRSHGGDASVVMAAERRIQDLARREGLAFELDRLNANTFDVHRVLHHAEESGQGAAFFSLVQDRFFAGELNPFDTEALAGAAESIGLSGQRVRSILAGDDYTDAVRADVREGRELGARGVPFTVFDRRLAVSGAQTVDGYARTLDEAVGAAPETAAA